MPSKLRAPYRTARQLSSYRQNSYSKLSGRLPSETIIIQAPEFSVIQKRTEASGTDSFGTALDTRTAASADEARG